MKNTKILVADDHQEIREVIRVLLSSEGYEVIEAKDGNEAIEKCSQDVDLLILDIMMPDCNGYQACQQIRQISKAPILFLSAKGAESDKTLGFSSGGDDYLTKPFSYNELTARVKALLRRYYVYQGKESPSTEYKQLVFGQLVIDEASQKVLLAGKDCECTEIEYKILHLLVNHPRQVFSIQHIFTSVWQEDFYQSASNTVMVHMRNLRKKIHDDPQHPTYIKTVWGKGYTFDAIK
ncbi:DNA-binding response regulator [Erysipelotrichaceae bacterium MTC7]|nr:DNA-binding response regulator [Erysipelotrichaceae bacterium MTC7]